MKTFLLFITSLLLATVVGSVVSAIAPVPVELAIPSVFGLSIGVSQFIHLPSGTLNVITLANVNGPDGTEENIGGTEQYIYYAPVGDFTTIQAPSDLASGTTFASLVAIATSHVFAVGKHFYTLYCTMDKGKLGMEQQGEPDGFSTKPKVTIYHPGSKKEILGFARYSKSNNFIVLVPLADGVVHQIGTQQFPASISHKFDSASNSSGLRGNEFEITTAVALGAQIYEGAIALS